MIVRNPPAGTECSECGSPSGHNATCYYAIQERLQEISGLKQALRDIANSEPIPTDRKAYEFCVEVARDALQKICWRVETKGEIEMTIGITKYSDEFPGTRSNYNWTVRFDKTDGMIGITQKESDGSVKNRVLMSAAQTAALLKFIDQ
jgi:hypothetical protein